MRKWVNKIHAREKENKIRGLLFGLRVLFWAPGKIEQDDYFFFFGPKDVMPRTPPLIQFPCSNKHLINTSLKVQFSYWLANQFPSLLICVYRSIFSFFGRTTRCRSARTWKWGGGGRYVSSHSYSVTIVWGGEGLTFNDPKSLGVN